jgi:hypothetical protein
MPPAQSRAQVCSNGLDRYRIGRYSFGLALVLQDATTDVGVKPDQVCDRGMLGVRFEAVGHSPIQILALAP